jgi:hypothetical protein
MMPANRIAAGEGRCTVAVPAVRLAEVFVEVADTRDDEFDLGAYLKLVAGRAAEVAASDAAGVLLADHQDQLRFVAGSDEATVGAMSLLDTTSGRQGADDIQSCRPWGPWPPSGCSRSGPSMGRRC